jgi:hypothetical protein
MTIYSACPVIKIRFLLLNSATPRSGFFADVEIAFYMDQNVVAPGAERLAE